MVTVHTMLDEDVVIRLRKIKATSPTGTSYSDIIRKLLNNQKV